MEKNRLIILFLFFTLVFGSVFYIFHKFSFAATDAAINATIKISVCGNNIKEGGEQCDGSDLGGASCATQGFIGGTLSCSASCTFNTSQCTSAPPGGGRGGEFFNVPPITGVTLSGRAYPKSTVTVLKDAQIAATTIADANANFSVSITGLSGGNYIFSVYSEDAKGIRSSLLTFPVSVTSGVITNIGGIFIAPTIAVDKSEVKRGDNIAIFGQSTPQADIIISINSEKEFFGKTSADQSGAYLYNFDTSQIEMGQHFTKSKAAKDGAISPFSQTISFLVGVKTVFAQPPTKCPPKADLNNDCRVNLVDFSIAAYWYKRPISAEFRLKESEKLNGDGKVNLVDFSIMAYYWTG